MNDPDKSPPRLSLRGFARHAGVSPSRIHKLCVEGVIPRDADGLIDVAQADAILAERREMAPPMLMAANLERKQQRQRPATPEEAEEHDDGERFDPVFCDAMLDAQPSHMRERVAHTPVERVLEAWELRMAHAQNDILARTAEQLRGVVGTDVAKDARHRAILGELFGRLRGLLDTERGALESSLEFLARGSTATRQ